MPHSFQTLKSLNLRKVGLRDEDIQYITKLKLVKLDLASTGISTEATAHLVALKRTLQELDLSNNPKIKHWACYNVCEVPSGLPHDCRLTKPLHHSQLAALKDLTSLNLAGTQIRMLSLRYLVEAWSSPKNLDLFVPSALYLFL